MRHAKHFVSLVNPKQRQPDRNAWLSKLVAEHDNFRAVLGWSLSGADPSLGLRLTAGLAWFWNARAHHIEGLRWTLHALDANPEESSEARAKALYGAAQLAYVMGQYDRVELLHSEALAIFRELGDKRNVAKTLGALGRHLSQLSQYEKAKSLLAESLRLSREIGDKRGIASNLNYLGELARLNADYKRAETLYEESLALSRELGDDPRVISPTHNLGHIAQHQGDYERARVRFEEALVTAQAVGSDDAIAHCLAGLAGVCGATKRPDRAARLFGAAEAIHQAIGARMQTADRLDFEQNIAAVREQLDEATFEAAWEEGRSMTLEAAVAYALGEDRE